MVEKDAKIREMRRENLLLLSKIQLLENQMEGLNDRVDRTLRERNQLRREINTVRLDTNVSIEVITPLSLLSRHFLFLSRRVLVLLPFYIQQERTIILRWIHQALGIKLFITVNRLASMVIRMNLRQSLENARFIRSCLLLFFMLRLRHDPFAIDFVR